MRNAGFTFAFTSSASKAYSGLISSETATEPSDRRGSVEALEAYARNLSERIIPRGVETHEVVGIVLLLRDVLARSLFKKYQSDFGLLNRVLDAYEPADNRIARSEEHTS